MSHPVLQLVADNADKPAVGLTLLAAGFVPMWMPEAFSIQSIYYLLLIPPTAYHCYAWFKASVWPTLKRWYEVLKE